MDWRKKIINFIFAMDDPGNRESTILRDGSGDTYSVDTQTNRYTAIDSAALAYDDAGNLTQDKGVYKFTYDEENRITEIRNSSDVLMAKTNYDTQKTTARKQMNPIKTNISVQK